jgi:hypothetical protein
MLADILDAALNDQPNRVGVAISLEGHSTSGRLGKWPIKRWERLDTAQ